MVVVVVVVVVGGGGGAEWWRGQLRQPRWGVENKNKRKKDRGKRQKRGEEEKEVLSGKEETWPEDPGSLRERGEE